MSAFRFRILVMDDEKNLSTVAREILQLQSNGVL